ncbi:MAG TPA: hypothetical protein VF278_18800 [Pirellulales bacterium]
MGLMVRYVLVFVAWCILASLCAGAGTGRPFWAVLGVVAAIACFYFSLQRRKCPACGHSLIGIAAARAATYCMKCGTAYDGLKESLQPLALPAADEPKRLPGRRDPVAPDENPYRAPQEDGSELLKRQPPKLRTVIACVPFAVIFAISFLVTLQTASPTLGSAVAIGWTGSSCAAFCAVAVGALLEKTWLMVTGALAILIGFTLMFTFVISFPGR